MTNLEHYLKDIIDINYGIAVSKKTGKLGKCYHDIRCDDCQFYDENLDECAIRDNDVLHWMLNEYKEYDESEVVDSDDN